MNVTIGKQNMSLLYRPVSLSVIAADEILFVGAFHHSAVGQFRFAERKIYDRRQFVTSQRKSASQLLHLAHVLVDVSVAAADRLVVGLVVTISWTSRSVELIQTKWNRDFVDVLSAIFSVHLASIVV